MLKRSKVLSCVGEDMGVVQSPPAAGQKPDLNRTRVEEVTKPPWRGHRVLDKYFFRAPVSINQ
jgi:hypothetical protein